MSACAETEIPSETDAVAKALNTVINNMDLNLATKKAATKRTKQAVAEPIMARLEKASGPTRRDHHEA